MIKLLSSVSISHIQHEGTVARSRHEVEANVPPPFSEADHEDRPADN
jgi:hypothetical protein